MRLQPLRFNLPRHGISHHSLTARLMHLLRQGLTPEKLALSLALGVGFSCFPVFGTTTTLCTIVALAFRLNLPAIQIGNYLALPLQLGLFIPFLRLGERVFHANRFPLAPEQLRALTKTTPDKAAHVLLAAQWHAIVGWLIVAPGIILALTFLLQPPIRLLLLRAKLEPNAITIQK
jgi:uncharacterized protein (DUF2062 family)